MKTSESPPPKHARLREGGGRHELQEIVVVAQRLHLPPIHTHQLRRRPHVVRQRRPFDREDDGNDAFHEDAERDAQLTPLGKRDGLRVLRDRSEGVQIASEPGRYFTLKNRPVVRDGSLLVSRGFLDLRGKQKVRYAGAFASGGSNLLAREVLPYLYCLFSKLRKRTIF